MKKRSVSLVLPMFNEKEYLEKSVSVAISVLQPSFPDFEVIVVDDASNDGSEKTADKLANADRRVRVVHHQKNRKLGGVLKTGFSAAEKDIVIYADIDLPFDFALLKDFIKLTDNVDIVNGYRVTHEKSFKRKLYSLVYNALVRAIFGLKVKDVNFSMKIFKRSILEQLELKSEGSFISAEALIKSQYLGYDIAQAPVVYFPRRWGRSRLSSLSVVIKTIYEMIKFFPEISLLRIKMSYACLKARMHNFVRRLSCPFEAIKKYIPETADVYDLGCGYGLLMDFLPGFSAGRRRFIGFDVDAAKISMAGMIHRRENAVFAVRDISCDLGIRGAECIVLIDTLMLMPFAEQEKLLTRCLDYLSPAGRLVVKEIDTRPFWKFAWHQFQETLVLKVFRFIRGKGIYCRPRKDLVSLFERSGYKVEVVDIQKGYPYPHVLYICAKR